MFKLVSHERGARKFRRFKLFDIVVLRSPHITQLSKNSDWFLKLYLIKNKTIALIDPGLEDPFCNYILPTAKHKRSPIPVYVRLLSLQSAKSNDINTNAIHNRTYTFQQNRSSIDCYSRWKIHPITPMVVTTPNPLFRLEYNIGELDRSSATTGSY